MDTSFETKGAADWRTLVEGELGGADAFTEKLVTRTLEGLDVQPLYGDRGGDDEAAARRAGGWEIAAEVAHPAPGTANRRALEELAGGATALHVPLDPAGTGTEGVRAASVPELDALLDGVWLDAAPVAFGTHAEGLALLAAVEALAAERGVAREALLVHLGYDPLATLARDGALPGDLDDVRRELHLVAAHARTAHDRARSLAVDTTVWHRAGGDALDELALGAAAFVQGLRWLEEAGLPPSAAHSEYVWRFDVGRDVFHGVAKLRAARALHARILGAAGVSEATPMVQHAFTTERDSTPGDPWTNMLRSTLGVTAAAIGGADLITTRPFDAPARGANEMREASALGRRYARNTQLVLRDECGLGRVGDPTRGSAYIEALTDEYARGAWERFRAIEAAGGLATYLTSGALAEHLAERRAALADAVASGQRPLLGATHFPPPADARKPEPAPLTGLDALEDSRARALAARGNVALGAIDTVPHAVEAAAKGATFAELGGALVRGAGLSLPPLEPVREADLTAQEAHA